MLIRFSFKVMEYFGKYKKSRKAVDLIIIDDGLGGLSGIPGLNITTTASAPSQLSTWTVI